MSAKDNLKRFTARHAPLEKAMFWFYRLKNGAAAERETAHRQGLSIFDFERLSADMPYLPEERVIDNNMYGYAHYLKRYAGIEHDLQAYLEHGLFLGGIVHKDQHHWHFEKIITMSQQREKIVQQKLPQKKPIAVGPYIHYAPPLLSATAMQNMKKELGRVLLVFPFHSMKNVKVGFNEQEFVEEIKRYRSDFDTVLICLYYLDAQNPERVRPYTKEGFKLVTAGHKFDRNFVARQRAHIELADMTMSNGMGTQTGYCIYLNKPHYIYRQDVAQKAVSAKEMKRFTSSSGQTEKERVKFERDFFARLFGQYSEEISAQQWEITSRYWGFEDVKTAAELRSLFG